jgi:hypothetical protein
MEEKAWISCLYRPEIGAKDLQRLTWVDRLDDSGTNPCTMVILALVQRGKARTMAWIRGLMAVRQSFNGGALVGQWRCGGGSMRS